MKDYLDEFTRKHPELAGCFQNIQMAYQVMEACYRQGGKLLVCGNGGSAADSEHIVGELMKGYMLPRPIPEADRQLLLEAFPVEGSYLADSLQRGFPAIALTSQSALISATANDVAADMVFAQQVYAYGNRGDVLLGISVSGKARNVIQAVQVARTRGVHTIGLTGKSGGDLASLCDVAICAPGGNVPETQEFHIMVYHALCAQLEESFFST